MKTSFEQLASALHESDMDISDIQALLQERLETATVVEVLGDDASKTLAVMQDSRGDLFVKRTYHKGAESEYEYPDGGSAITFEEAFTATQNMYAAAGLPLVRSIIVPELPGLQNQEKTIISDYIPNLISLSDAPLEVKKEVTTGLAKLLNPGQPYLPSLQAVIPSSFMATKNEDGTICPIIVDVDPKLTALSGHFFASIKDSSKARFIDMVNELINNTWSTHEGDDRALARTFILNAPTSLMDTGVRTFEAVMRIHSTSQGFDARLR